MKNFNNIKLESYRRTVIYLRNMNDTGYDSFDRWYNSYHKDLLHGIPYPYSHMRANDLRYSFITRLLWKIRSSCWQLFRYNLKQWWWPRFKKLFTPVSNDRYSRVYRVLNKF